MVSCDQNCSVAWAWVQIQIDKAELSGNYAASLLGRRGIGLAADRSAFHLLL